MNIRNHRIRNHRNRNHRKFKPNFGITNHLVIKSTVSGISPVGRNDMPEQLRKQFDDTESDWSTLTVLSEKLGQCPGCSR